MWDGYHTCSDSDRLAEEDVSFNAKFILDLEFSLGSNEGDSCEGDGEVDSMSFSWDDVFEVEDVGEENLGTQGTSNVGRSTSSSEIVESKS